jgi:geranylgeranyl reductase family protein
MYDLIIVGGGPAGSSAGRTAGRLGLRALLLEKEVFPREKPCGGALSARALASLDFLLPPALQAQALTGARVCYRGRKVEAHLSAPYAFLVSRSDFDHFLLTEAEKAGIEIHQGEKVLGLCETDGGISVRTPAGIYTGRCALIAEGAQGQLKRRARRCDTRAEQGFAIVTEIPVTQPHAGIAEIHFGLSRWGYGWIFPHAGYLSVGVGGLIPSMPPIRESLRAFLRENGLPEEYRCRGHVIPMGGICRNLVNGRILLYGDAAGFADPLRGEGIAYAIRSGQLAAEAVHRALTERIEALAEYEAACERAFGGELRDALFLTRLVHRFPAAFHRLFSSHPRVVATYLEVVAGTRNYRSFLAWALPRMPAYLALREICRPALAKKS